MPFPVAALLGAAGIGAIGNIVGGKLQSDSAGKIAEEQLKFARENQERALGAAEITASELEQYDLQLRTQRRFMALQEAAWLRDSDILNAINPSIMAAVNNATHLLQGGDAPVLSGIKKRRDIQRRQLEGRLQSQLGPGYENSSAGIEYLNRFDTETENILSEAQAYSLNSVGNYLGQGVGAQTNIIGSENQSAGTIGQLQSARAQGLGRIQERKINAINGSNVAPYGGAGHVGAGLQGQNIAALGNNLGRLAGFAAAYGFGGNDNGGGGGGGNIRVPGIGDYLNGPNPYGNSGDAGASPYRLGDFNRGGDFG